MYCKLCRFRDKDSVCQNENLTEPTHSGSYDGDVKPGGHRLIYSFSEDGCFYVEDYFGCVHFEKNEDLFGAIEDLVRSENITRAVVLRREHERKEKERKWRGLL